MVRTMMTSEEVETVTKHFLAREQNIQKERNITEITNENGDKTTDKNERKTEFRKFYMKLYAKKDDPGREEHAIPDEYFKELEEEEKVKMEEEISTSQMKESTSNLNRNKSPAPEGLTSEFYKTFNKQLTPILHPVLKKIYETNEVPEEMARSYITIIPRGKEDKTYLTYQQRLQNYK